MKLGRSLERPLGLSIRPVIEGYSALAFAILSRRVGIGLDKTIYATLRSDNDKADEERRYTLYSADRDQRH